MQSIVNLNFLLATHIPLATTDSTSLSLWVQKSKILATFKRLHLNERNKIVFLISVLRVSLMWQGLRRTLFYRPNDLQSDTENIWHGRNDQTRLVGKTNGKPSFLCGDSLNRLINLEGMFGWEGQTKSEKFHFLTLPSVKSWILKLPSYFIQ